MRLYIGEGYIEYLLTDVVRANKSFRLISYVCVIANSKRQKESLGEISHRLYRWKRCTMFQKRRDIGDAVCWQQKPLRERTSARAEPPSRRLELSLAANLPGITYRDEIQPRHCEFFLPAKTEYTVCHGKRSYSFQIPDSREILRSHRSSRSIP